MTEPLSEQERLLALVRGEARKHIAVHLAKAHADRDGNMVILEGTDFLCGPAPLRCDLCMTAPEPPHWTYTTGPELAVEDPEWLVCVECHDVIQLNSGSMVLEMLVERSLREQLSNLVLDDIPVQQVRLSIRDTIQGFLAHLAGEPTRS